MEKFADYINKKQSSVPYYVLKYEINLQPNDTKISRKETLELIHHYEMKNMTSLINGGRDKHTNEIGYFIQS